MSKVNWPYCFRSLVSDEPRASRNPWMALDEVVYENRRVPLGFFYKLDKIGNKTNISIRGYYMKTKKSSNKMLPPVSIELLVSDSKFIPDETDMWKIQLIVLVMHQLLNLIYVI